MRFEEGKGSGGNVGGMGSGSGNGGSSGYSSGYISGFSREGDVGSSSGGKVGVFTR